MTGIQGDRKFKFVDAVLATYRETGSVGDFWDSGGMPLINRELLGQLLTPPVQNGSITQDGCYAAAVEMWIAEELRRAGFEEECVWPRRTYPRVISPDIARLIVNYDHPSAFEARLIKLSGKSDARVWGSAYTKQTDAGIASSWSSGPEALISIKTQSSSFGKNANNRIEESYGDGKNLKRRFPLACTGYVLVVRDTIIQDEPRAFERYIHALKRFADNHDAYDTASLVCVHWDESGKVTVPKDEAGVVPFELSPEHFFKTVIESVLECAPYEQHALARALRYGVPEADVSF